MATHRSVGGGTLNEHGCMSIAPDKLGRCPFLLSLLLLLFSSPLTILAGSLQLPQTGQKTYYDTTGTVNPCTSIPGEGYFVFMKQKNILKRLAN